MKGVHRKIQLLIALGLVLATGACEEDYFYEVPPPRVAQATATLEAVKVSTPPATIGASFWKTADFLKVSAADLSTQQLFGDGLMNMTGTFAGLSSFNNGAAPDLKLRAAYDNDNLYILAEWTDTDVDASHSTWLWNGPLDPKKADANLGWTSQRNCDKIAFAFDIANASSSNGLFSNVGCAAACHNDGVKNRMHPQSGSVDIWNWSVARSNPMGYAEDLTASSDSFYADGGQKMYVRNTLGSTNRSGPAFEWDGNSQSVTLGNGSNTVLDPAYFLLNKMPFTGNVQRGDSIYHSAAPPGDCVYCHGPNGTGGSASAVNHLSQNKKSRAALLSGMDNVPDMAAYWSPLSQADKDDLVAYLRALSGVPGYYLAVPTGSSADIIATSNITPVQLINSYLPSTNVHTKYQVLIIRKLKTNNTDDIQFDLTASKSYRFGVALMDNDGVNHIGSAVETLTFK
ncbi:MAG: c-type cytochrome [Bacteroidia bacterium]|nr:c-type cytochrome [Bacteroidia bacterium]